MKQGKKNTGRRTTLILLITLLIGLSLLLYPTVSNYWNSIHQTKAIADYSESVAAIDKEKYDAIWKEAQEFNAGILKRGNIFALTEEEAQKYAELLDVSGTGVMGYIEIPEINVSLPIYHGTDDGVLQIAVGHLDWTSLPTGGLSTHCVLSGHRGLPSASLFTNLDELAEGDTFILRVLDEILTYEVDQLRIVLPEETDELQIVEGKDYCTLVTCTPYGVNTHRLLVRGHRVENVEQAASIRVTADAVQIEPLVVAPVLAIPLLLLMIVIVYLRGNNRKRADKSRERG